MADEYHPPEDPVDEGKDRVEVDVLLVLGQGPQHVGGEHQREDEDQGGAHHLGGGTLLGVEVVELRNNFSLSTFYAFKK